MANWLTRRFYFWREVFYNKVRAGVGILITLTTLGFVIRDAVLNPKYRDWFLLQYVPTWPWYSWVIIGLSALLVLVFDSAYRTYATAVDVKPLPVIDVAIKEALIQPRENLTTLDCFLYVRLHNETDNQSNVSDYSLTIKINNEEYHTDHLLNMDDFSLTKFIIVDREDGQAEEQEIGREYPLPGLDKLTREERTLKREVSVSGWLGLVAHAVQLPCVTQTIEGDEIVVEVPSEDGGVVLETIRDYEVVYVPIMEAIKELSLTMLDAYGKPHNGKKLPPFSNGVKRMMPRHL